LFVGTNLIDTSIPIVVCYVGTNLLTSLPSVSFAFPSLVYFMLLSSPNLLCIYYFFFHRIFALVTSAFTRSALHPLHMLLPDQLDNHSFCWIFLVLTPCAFARSIRRSFLLFFLFLHRIFLFFLLVMSYIFIYKFLLLEFQIYLLLHQIWYSLIFNRHSLNDIQSTLFKWYA